MGLRIVILAAGKGKRMLSDRPKVLEKMGGITLLEHVVKTAVELNPAEIIVVYGNGGSTIPELLNYLPVTWVEQKEQLGTGHAVMQALPLCQDEDQILVLYGDVPLIASNTLNRLLKKTPENGVALIVTEVEDPSGFGRIIRDAQDEIVAIVEHKDASHDQLCIREINTGILTTKAKYFKSWLPQIKNQNKQNEYYLTDVISMAVNDHQPVIGVSAESPKQLQGVNDQWQLTQVERYYQLMQAQKLAFAGVNIRDPYRLDIRGEVKVSADVTLDINVILEGKVSIGKNSIIGPHVILKDVTVGENVEILAHSVIEGAVIENGAKIGPFARLRPDTVIEANARVGNFVEIKKTRLGPGSKAPHLTYLGDSIIGKNVNIGAGTITCNYDGIRKWETKIADNVFIGSNTSLVAPLNIGPNATIGAGSTITRNAPDGKLTVARAKQTTIENWQNPREKEEEKLRLADNS